jgi:hypothetical protein
MLAREAVEIAGDDPSLLWRAGCALWQLRIDFDDAADLYERIPIRLRPSVCAVGRWQLPIIPLRRSSHCVKQSG